MSVSEVIECLESESDLELEQNKSPTKMEALHCLQTIKYYLASISEAIDIDYTSLYKIEKRILRSTSRARVRTLSNHTPFCKDSSTTDRIKQSSS